MNTEPTNINLENINLEGDIDTKKSNSIEPTKATQQTKTAFGYVTIETVVSSFLVLFYA